MSLFIQYFVYVYDPFIFEDIAEIVLRIRRCKRTSWNSLQTQILTLTADLLNVI